LVFSNEDFLIPKESLKKESFQTLRIISAGQKEEIKLVPKLF
jgi:hypothetical protein